MPERTSYDPGTPSWVDLSTTDTDAAKRFYGELFGWQAVDSGPVEETGGYAFFQLAGRNVAGVGPTMAEGQPPAWATYFATADADATTEAAKAAGATAMFGPMDAAVARAVELGGSEMMPATDLEGVGRIAVVVDPQGAPFSVMKAASAE